jgi:hypothetical protein
VSKSGLYHAVYLHDIKEIKKAEIFFRQKEYYIVVGINKKSYKNVGFVFLQYKKNVFYYISDLYELF